MNGGAAELRWSSAAAGSQQLSLVGGAYRIGRDPAGEIVIQAPGVSQRHALLEQVGRDWLLTDLGSTNGLWWRGRRVQQLLLCDGDRIQLAPGDPQEAAELEFRRPGGRLGRLARRAGSAGLAAIAASGVLLLGLGWWQLPLRSGLGGSRGPLLLYDGANRPILAAESQQHREQRRLGGYPPELVAALLASEDNRFWRHPGIDPIGTARALLTNLVSGRVREGGSTLTQQLARSLYPDQVGRGETLARKWRELLVALQLEAGNSKRNLLLHYLNRVYLGVGWGFEDASRHYFGKGASQLQLEEAALLVGLLPSPNGFDPCSNPQAALRSRNRVLEKMVEAGRLSEARARQARRQPLMLAPTACAGATGQAGTPMPFYTDQVRRDLEALLGADVAAEGNFLVSTHLDPLLQQVVERKLRERLSRSGARGPSQGAVVVLDSRNGGVLAIAGGRDYSQSQYNRASMALRQPGSTFKLFAYLAALEQGVEPGERVGCGPLSWGGQSFGSGCGGTLALRAAFASSSNTAALRLARRVGLERVVQMARKLGITTPLEPVPGLALGQAEVRLIELTAAYAAVANGGVWHAPTTIRQLTDTERQRPGASATRPLQASRRVLQPQQASAMQALLRSVVREGTGRAARLGGAEGGKTGTTNDGRDLLFVGYEPSRHWVAGVWLGNDDNSPTGASSALAAGLWAEIIRTAQAAHP